MVLSDHGPIHTDSISHFNPDEDAETVAEMPLHMFYTGAICVDVTDIQISRDYITTGYLKNQLEKDDFDVRTRDTILLHTGHWNRNWGTDEYLYNYGGLTREAAEWLAEQRVVNIGVDAPSIDSSAEMERQKQGEEYHFPVHRVCKEHSMTNTENLTNLDKIAGERVTYVGIPLALRGGGTGSPARAIGSEILANESNESQAMPDERLLRSV